MLPNSPQRVVENVPAVTPLAPSLPPPLPFSFLCAQRFQIFLQGVNSTAIGLVVAACVVLWEGSVETYADAMVAVTAGCMQVRRGLGFFFRVFVVSCVLRHLLSRFTRSIRCVFEVRTPCQRLPSGGRRLFFCAKLMRNGILLSLSRALYFVVHAL